LIKNEKHPDKAHFDHKAGELFFLSKSWRIVVAANSIVIRNAEKYSYIPFLNQFLGHGE
jgi:hypothetical protein